MKDTDPSTSLRSAQDDTWGAAVRNRGGRLPRRFAPRNDRGAVNPAPTGTIILIVSEADTIIDNCPLSIVNFLLRLIH